MRRVVRNTLGKGFFDVTLPYPFTSLFQKKGCIGYNNIKVALVMNNKFTQWGQLFECKTLKGNQRIILGIILSLHNIEGWDFTPLSVLEERSGFTRPTIIKNLNELVAKGLLNKLMNKSRQTNGIPPNDYIPIYDNIHNLLNSQRLKNFTFSQQEELKNFTTKRLKNFTKEKKKKENIVKRVKENIKEKRESNEMVNGKLNHKDEVKEKQSNNNMNFNKNGMYMELNSHPTVQSKDWTKETKEEKTHSSSTGTTKVIQIGDTRYAVETANTDYSSIWDSFPGGTASRENKKLQQATTTEDLKDNTLSNASLHNENEDNPKASEATETAHRGFNGAQVDNYPTHTKKTSQERNNEGNMDTHNPMDCGGMSIDDLEDIYNGGNQTPTQPISKVRSQTTSKAKSNEGGGGRKFTPRKEWELLMENINTKVNNNIRPTRDEMNIIMEGARDKYRVITTLKVIYKMLFVRLKINGYGLILTTCGDTLEDNKEAYTHKQYDFAWSTYDKCVDQFDIFKLENPTLNQ